MGYLADGSRAWFGRKVILPDGTLAKIGAVWRGQAGVMWDDPFSIQGTRMGRFRVEQLKPYRVPAAVAMGRRKAGVIERVSPKKAAANRINGRRPVRAGHRPRGRPPKATQPPPSRSA
jgi:hypothetical protein